jgi:hypothetical protein
MPNPKSCFPVWLALLALACMPTTSMISTEPLPAVNQLFYRESGRTGGDAIESIGLTPDKILSLFGDSMFGEIQNGRRKCPLCFTHNSIAIHQNNGVAFYFGPALLGVPTAIFSPPDNVGWLWPGNGIRTLQGLYIFFWQFERDSDPR